MALRPSRSGFDLNDSSAVGALAFMAFVVGGSAYIIAAKLNEIGRIYVTLVPVLIMISYAVLVWSARSLRLRDDQAGDNLYYMGFLFTLTSLGVSLYQFNAERAAEDIVQNFGIAIGSTITGIALRVVFNQMRRDPIEVERLMRLELADAARRVRRAPGRPHRPPPSRRPPTRPSAAANPGCCPTSRCAPAWRSSTV